MIRFLLVSAHRISAVQLSCDPAELDSGCKRPLVLTVLAINSRRSKG
jgi:hypothetical protein